MEAFDPNLESLIINGKAVKEDQYVRYWAEGGEVVAMRLYANFLVDKCSNSASSIDEALFWYDKARSEDCAESAFQLAVLKENLYLEGNAEITKADVFDDYILAQSMGSVSAAYSLGLIYEEGKFTQEDLDKAAFYFEAAANGGDVEAATELAELYEREGRNDDAFLVSYKYREMDPYFLHKALELNDKFCVGKDEQLLEIRRLVSDQLDSILQIPGVKFGLFVALMIFLGLIVLLSHWLLG